jgi:hypothetical protein
MFVQHQGSRVFAAPGVAKLDPAIRPVQRGSLLLIRNRERIRSSKEHEVRERLYMIRQCLLSLRHRAELHREEAICLEDASS